MFNRDIDTLQPPMPKALSNDSGQSRARSKVRDLSAELFTSESRTSHARARPFAHKYVLRRPRLQQTAREDTNNSGGEQDQSIEFGPLLSTGRARTSDRTSIAELDKTEEVSNNHEVQKGQHHP
jgi:hypothetical protein